MKPKTSYPGTKYTAQTIDACQTPPYALAPLLPHISREWTVWEPAAGDGLLVEALKAGGVRRVLASDIRTDQDFFDYTPNEDWDCIITNPPYSIKYHWIERCYELRKPFALLLPVETIGAQKGQKLFSKYGVEILLLDQRVDFRMPRKGWSGSAAQFPVMWVCWHLLPWSIVFGSIKEEKRRFKLEMSNQKGE